MNERLLEREQIIETGIEEAFDFFSRAENLEAITPPWLGFRITTPTPIEMEAGTLIRYRLRLRGIPIRWLTRIEEWQPPAEGSARFVDRQLKGPYALWHHTHLFSAIDADTTRMVDRVRYAQRLGPLGRLAEPLVRRDLRRIFDFRYETIAAMIGNGQEPPG